MPANGIEWLIQLDAKTGGAATTIAAMDRVQLAAEAMGKTIDRVLSRIEKPTSWNEMEKNARRAMDSYKASVFGGESAAVAAFRKSAEERKVAAEAEKREHLVQATRNRDALLMRQRTSEWIARIEKDTERLTPKAESMWKEVLHEVGWKEVAKGELAVEGIKMGAELAIEAVKKLGETMYEAVMVAGGSARTHKVFGNMLGAEAGEETLEYLAKFSEMAEFTDDALVGMGNELLRAGLRAADWRNAMAGALDVAAEAPNKMEGMQEAVASFSRIALMGKVDARTLRGLRLNPHDVEDQLAKDLGLSKKTIAKQLQEGTLEGAKAMDSIFTVMEKKTGKKLGQLGADMADEFTAKVEKIRDIPEEIFKSLRSTAGFEDIKSALDGVLEAFGEDSAFGKTAREGLSDMLKSIAREMKAIDWDNAASALSELVTLTKEWVEPLKAVAKALAGVGEFFLTLPKLGNTIGDWFARKMNGNSRQLNDVKGMEAEDVLARHGVKPATIDSTTYLNTRGLEAWANKNEREWNKLMAEQAAESKALGHEMTAGLLKGVGGESKAEAAGEKLAEAANAGVRKAAEIHSPSRLFREAGDLMAEGLAQGLEGGQFRVQAASAAMVPASLPDMSRVQLGGGGGFTVGDITIPIVVQGGSQATAQDIAQEVKLQVPSAILAIFEQIVAQGGAS